jgi:hypothetical protein
MEKLSGPRLFEREWIFFTPAPFRLRINLATTNLKPWFKKEENVY